MNDKKSLLIVDDDIAHRTMLRILLDWEYEIFEADDGFTTIRKIQERSFDLVIMDVRMIKLSGVDALVRIKALKPAIPVVMMTAFWTQTAADEARQKGAFDYLAKPFDFHHLKQTIQSAVACRQPKHYAV
jgi:two-component system response regulator HydG